MVAIAFDARIVNERGTSVALYDYADAAERLLGCRPIIFHESGGAADDVQSLRRFRDRFEVISYSNFADLEANVRGEGADLFYTLKIGKRDGRLVGGVRNAVHVIFQHYEPHGDVYAYVSQWLSEHMTMGRQPWVPHIVSLPLANANLRPDWGLPADAVILGRHGGYDQFDLPFAHAAVELALARRGDLHFVFVNTAPFIRSSRVKFLPPIYDPQAKANFIAACDGMIHARKAGESFGLAIAEFLALDKPVICWEGGKDRNHVAMVPGRERVYRSGRDLLRILTTFQPHPGTGVYRAAVASFSPEAVMRRFQAVFIDGEDSPAPPPWPFRLRSKLATRAIVLRGRLWRDRGLAELRSVAAR
ncbi:MAG: glycosyltransferase [Caulobacterales bacterium]